MSEERAPAKTLTCAEPMERYYGKEALEALRKALLERPVLDMDPDRRLKDHTVPDPSMNKQGAFECEVLGRFLCDDYSVDEEDDEIPAELMLYRDTEEENKQAFSCAVIQLTGRGFIQFFLRSQ